MRFFLKVMGIVALIEYGAILPFSIGMALLIGLNVAFNDVLLLLGVFSACFLFSTLLAFIFVRIMER